MPYKIKISGQQFQTEIEGASDWTRTVTRDFNDRLFRTVGGYEFTGHRGLYNLLYNHLTINGVCDALEGRIYFDTGTGWDYEWKGDILPQDFEFDLIRRSAAGQILDNSWAAKFNNSEDQKVFLRSDISIGGLNIGACNSQSALIFNPTTGVYDVDFRKVFKIYDVFTFLVAYYTDNTVTFESDYLNTGDGSIYFITTGNEIRAVDERANPEVSFSELFSEMNKKCNLWIIIEGTNDAPILRIEPYSYVFAKNKILDIVDPEKINMTTDLDQLYSVVKVGSTAKDYNTTENANYPNPRFFAWNNEEYNVTDRCQFENNVLDLVSTYKIDHNSIERQYSFVGQDQGDFDSDIFILEIQETAGIYSAIKYETDYTGSGTVEFAYNQTLINEVVIDRWFDGIPSQIAKEISTDFSARVSRTSIQSPVTFPWEAVKFNNDSTPPNFDTDGIYDTTNFYFIAPISGFYRFSGLQYLQIFDSGGTQAQMVVRVYVDTGLTTQISETFGERLTTTTPIASIGVPYNVLVFMNAGNVAQVEPFLYDRIGDAPDIKTLNIQLGYCLCETDNENYLPDAIDNPLIFNYDIGQHKLSREDFNSIDQGLGFVRIIDTNARKKYDVYCKSVKYNGEKAVIESGEFVGGRPPTELCWLLQDGAWDDDCYWIDSEYWNG